MINQVESNVYRDSLRTDLDCSSSNQMTMASSVAYDFSAFIQK